MGVRWPSSIVLAAFNSSVARFGSLCSKAMAAGSWAANTFELWQHLSPFV